MTHKDINASQHGDLTTLKTSQKSSLVKTIKIMEGKQDYAKIFSFQLYKKYQDDVDAILIAEGREDLIKR